MYVILCIFTTYVQHIHTQHYTFSTSINQPLSFSIQHKAILCIFIFTMLDWSLLTGFSIPIKVVQLLIFSSNGFLKQQIGTFKLTKLELFRILKLTCTQFAEVQKCFHVFNEKKHKIKITSKVLYLMQISFPNF